MRTLPHWHSHLSGRDRLDVAGGALVGGRGRAPGAGPQATTKNALAQQVPEALQFQLHEDSAA